MADHYAYYKQKQITDRKINRVYINPNFNKSDNIPSSCNMYFNPNFSHVVPNLYHQHIQGCKDQVSKLKIHINPNFIRDANPVFTNSVKDTITKTRELKQEAINQFQAPSTHVTKSRYCFVRQKENIITKTSILKPTTTVRVNKYKSVSLNVIKNKLATARPTNSTIDASVLQNEKYHASVRPIVDNVNTRFKLVKPSTSIGLNQSQTKHVAVRRYSFLNKSILKKAPRKINNKLILKKNNIPCPLFTKFGECLRKVRGNCEYLHDKKHVSICRKFLKGICHDKKCLLSHDLTDKKMPTCYFYLQGACTKESCPYLHVKLNEKTKICQDFLRGYCEKGDKCLFRHINVCRDTASKKVSLKKQLTYSPASKSNSVVKLKSRKKSLEMLSQHKNAGKKLQDNNAEEQRYFKGSVEDKSSCEKCDVIKPSRIKLGTLPSFIQI